MRVKFFWKNEPMNPCHGFLWSKVSGQNALAMETEINAWLNDHPTIKIVDIKQTASGGSLAGSLWLITVWYEESA